MYIPGRSQGESFLYNTSGVSNMLAASSFYMALPSIFSPLQNVAQLSVKQLLFFYLKPFFVMGLKTPKGLLPLDGNVQHT